MDHVDFDTRLRRFDGLCPALGFEFRSWLIENGYFTAPASTKYHGNYEGGLFDHSLAVANSLVELTEKNDLSWQDKRSPIIIGFFHDICKVDQYKQKSELRHGRDPWSGDPTSYTVEMNEWEYRNDMLLKGHGDKSVMILASHMQLTEEEVMCIRYHMGAFTEKSEWNDYTRAVQRYPNVLWTHQADMIAAHIMGT